MNAVPFFVVSESRATITLLKFIQFPEVLDFMTFNSYVYN